MLQRADGRREVLIGLLREFAESINADPECLNHSVHEPIDDEAAPLTVIPAYESLAGFEEHGEWMELNIRDWSRCSRPRPTLRTCSGRYRWAAMRRSLSPRSRVLLSHGTNCRVLGTGAAPLFDHRSELIALSEKETEMSIGLYERDHKSLSSRDSEPEPPTASLVVHLRRNAHSCIASFYGSLTNSTQVTIDGLAGLFAGEESVILDLSRVDVVDEVGEAALQALVQSVRERGVDLQIILPTGPSNKSFQVERGASACLPRYCAREWTDEDDCLDQTAVAGGDPNFCESDSVRTRVDRGVSVGGS
jgi:STAS domain-containing protein